MEIYIYIYRWEINRVRFGPIHTRMYRVPGSGEMNFSFVFRVLIRGVDNRSLYRYLLLVYNKIPGNRYGKCGRRYRDRFRGRVTFLPTVAKTRFSQAWQPSRHICPAFTISVKSGWRKLAIALPLPLPLISPIKLREQPNDSIERTAYASRSRNNWELPVIPRTDPIGIERGKGKKRAELVKPWLNRSDSIK